MNFLVEHRPQIAPEQVVALLGGWVDRVCRPFGSPGRDRARSQSHPKRNAIQPGADGLATAHARGLAHQDEKRRLERVFDVLTAAQQAATDAEDERAVPPDEHLEGGLVTSLDPAA